MYASVQKLNPAEVLAMDAELFDLSVAVLEGVNAGRRVRQSRA